MTAAVAEPGRQPAPTAALAALARYEIRRYIRSPIFLAAVGLTAFIVLGQLGHSLIDRDGLTVYPGSFLGGFGMIAAFWKTQSMRLSAEAVDVSPTSSAVRTGALCLTAVAPFACGLLSLLVIEFFVDVPGDWTYGTFVPTDRLAILLTQVVIPALGGPLLGVALGRWLDGAWVAVVAFFVILAWVLSVEGLAATYQNSVPVLWLRMFAPFAFFTAYDGGVTVESWRGSPMAFLAWQLCLCALAVIVALWRDAPANLRRWLLRALVPVLALAGLTYVLAVTGGLSHAVIVSPSGVVRPV